VEREGNQLPMKQLVISAAIALGLIVAIPWLICAWMGYKEKP